MKKFVLLALLGLFMVNMLLVLAWAAPCSHQRASFSVMHQNSSSADAMPCQEEQTETQKSHCEGSCFCAHVSSSITLYFADLGELNIPLIVTEEFAVLNEVLSSINETPLKQPPKWLS